MPYVKQEQRPDLDMIVNLMKEKGISANGDLIYILFSFCKKYVNPSYNNYKNFRGELFEISVEIQRRLEFAPVQEEMLALQFIEPSSDLDDVVELMKEKDVKANGDLNYILFAFCKRYVDPTIYENFIYELVEAIDKIGDELLAPYEDQKIEENGDV